MVEAYHLPPAAVATPFWLRVSAILAMLSASTRASLMRLTVDCGSALRRPMCFPGLSRNLDHALVSQAPQEIRAGWSLTRATVLFLIDSSGQVISQPDGV